MKYVFVFLLFLSFIAPSVEQGNDFGNIFTNSIYNYITCLDRGVDYLSKNVEGFEKISNFTYKMAYKKVMEDRILTNHLVSSGETLDDIIKKYNSDVDNIESFRKVVYMENKDIVSRDYEIKSGEYLVIPSD